MSDMYESKWLFKILDYEHWEIMYVGIPIGQAVINSADHSVSVRAYADEEIAKLPASSRRYEFWKSWLRGHERPYES